MTNKKPEQFLLSCQICQEASLWQKCIPPTVHLIEFLIAFKWSESWMREKNSVNPSSKFIFRKCILNNSVFVNILWWNNCASFFDIFCWIVQKGELWPLCLVPVNLTLVVLTKHPHRDRREIRGVRANTSHEIKSKRDQNKTKILAGTPACYKQFLPGLEEPEKSADAEK